MVLQSLTYVTDDEVRLVLSAPCKSSDLDPVPISLVKDCFDILVTPIAAIVNLSLSEGCFPSHFKSALVSPLLKKPTLNKDNLKNYRAFQNSRESCGESLNSHINSSKLSNHYQSAYIKFHSTAAALLKSTIYKLHIYIYIYAIWPTRNPAPIVTRGDIWRKLSHIKVRWSAGPDCRSMGVHKRFLKQAFNCHQMHVVGCAFNLC